MFIILAVQGSYPCIDTVKGYASDEAMTFSTEEEAQDWAKKHCAWDYNGRG